MPDTPGTRESTICLTFDFDAISLWLARGQTSPGPISRGEFGAHAIPRILAVLREREITATFFIPGHTVDTYPGQCAMIADAGHEIALHGYLHEPVSKLDRAGELAAAQRARESIRRVTGYEAVGNRTPSWDFTPSTVDVLLELGCEYDSSLMGTDYTPYYARRGDVADPDGPYRFGEPTSLVELPVSWSLDDYPQFEYLRTDTAIMPGLRSPDSVFRNFLDDVDYMIREEPGGVCVLTFHPQVIGRGHRMMGLERLLDACRERPVSFRTCLDTARAFRRGSA
ncbi:polysaccharide deacetylase [Streptosporangium sp. NBC_01639]|uniref:polysaccharide deacetylase family protein n=1 Tax=Streptosporangium sp. NBC_01639 TaxID=2975948 RepID=UPI00386DDB31|nr:polysaccharide deacetylase [Streptosporangium sp. NBC_01639]